MTSDLSAIRDNPSALECGEKGGVPGLRTVVPSYARANVVRWLTFACPMKGTVGESGLRRSPGQASGLLTSESTVESPVRTDGAEMGEVRCQAGAVSRLQPSGDPLGSQQTLLCTDAGDLREEGCRQYRPLRLHLP